MQFFRVGIAQIDSTVGDLEGNTIKILNGIDRARRFGVDLLTFPELAISGYLPEDLVYRSEFIDKELRSLDDIINHSDNITLVVGLVDIDKKNDSLYNAAAIVHNKKLAGMYHKRRLSLFGKYDESYYFKKGEQGSIYQISGVPVGISIGNDLLSYISYNRAKVIVNISSFPYYIGETATRENILMARAKDSISVILNSNMVGGQDGIIFDGYSKIIDEDGRIIAKGRQFDEDFIVADIDIDKISKKRMYSLEKRITGDGDLTFKMISDAPIILDKPKIQSRDDEREIEGLSSIGEIYNALVLGTKDYVIKNGFKKVVLGLSGGIDSSLVATIAVDAIGNDNVIGVMMPSVYTSLQSLNDAKTIANNLAIELLEIPIDKIYKEYLDQMEPYFKDYEKDKTEENIQSRIRGNLLMALSNKFGWLVLSTGNKSEAAVGYTTLYGDMAGGFSVISDVYKSMVYKLADYRNSIKKVIPDSIREKEPSAELSDGQKDTDILPPYDVLDPILIAYLDEGKSVEDIIRMGFERDTVRLVVDLIRKNEFKRRQAPIGIKITRRALRMPLTNRFKEF
ncbi:MAG: NAD+ synthase [Candidatus Methanoliparum thermophilum]|uniref:Glutamine-dependent NAD(+) synthetase n=1 Tax=Methanoliparum thermophilum TaxID=2491083 RepID=A0A520KR53_METT2|nr:NAD+ synthase [Candidatus Methanoliparum sp. LAM-1]RZN64059.1 MAG: NAD+ synthase [Candidatus Methanoliparum thermophilum]BDC35686.1 NAD+ synthase [Candidatus Methanoliparum sp. LAM-1]